MRILKLMAVVLAIVLVQDAANAAAAYNKSNVSKALQKAHTSGTCDYGVINDIVDWVVRRDPDASKKFGDAVRHGTRPYQALLDRLGHDQNAYNLISYCKAEAYQSLAAHGFGG